MNENLYVIGLYNDFLDWISKAQATKTKVDIWKFIKCKHLCTAEETIE
jgi:hypothetical protein